MTSRTATPSLRARKTTLTNGLTVLVLEDPVAPVVSIQVWYSVGSRHEESGRTGLAHLFEHMMFKGTRRHGPEVHARLVQSHGGVLNAFTTHDLTAYYENVSSDHLELCLALEADRMANLVVTPEKLASEREVVKEERRMRTDNAPQGVVFEEIFGLAYRAHPYRNPVVGWMADLDRATARDCQLFYRRHYAPDTAVLVVSGDVRERQVLALARRHFGPLRPARRPRPALVAEPAQHGERRATVRAVAQLPQIVFAWHAPAAGDRDLRALDALAQVLSHGESSRLHRTLVYERRVALGAFTDLYETSDPGLFFGVVHVAPGRSAAEAEAAFRAEIERIRTRRVDHGELAKAKRLTRAGVVFQLASAHSRGRLAARAESMHGDWRKANSLLPQTEALTREDLLHAARRYLLDDNLSVVTLVPENGTPR